MKFIKEHSKNILKVKRWRWPYKRKCQDYTVLILKLVIYSLYKLFELWEKSHLIADNNYGHLDMFGSLTFDELIRAFIIFRLIMLDSILPWLNWHLVDILYIKVRVSYIETKFTQLLYSFPRKLFSNLFQ